VLKHGDGFRSCPKVGGNITFSGGDWGHSVDVVVGAGHGDEHACLRFDVKFGTVEVEVSAVKVVVVVEDAGDVVEGDGWWRSVSVVWIVEVETVVAVGCVVM